MNVKQNTVLLVCSIMLLSTNTMETIEAVDKPPTPKHETIEKYHNFVNVSNVYDVKSEGVSTYYYNTTVYGVREGEQDVITSTQDIHGLGEDMCVGRPLDDNPDNTQYACVVLPESLSDTYGRGDIVLVEYDNNDGINGIIPCVVIDFNQTEHGDNLNFVGDFHPPNGATAWIVEERK